MRGVCTPLEKLLGVGRSSTQVNTPLYWSYVCSVLCSYGFMTLVCNSIGATTIYSTWLLSLPLQGLFTFSLFLSVFSYYTAECVLSRSMCNGFGMVTLIPLNTHLWGYRHFGSALMCDMRKISGFLIKISIWKVYGLSSLCYGPPKATLLATGASEVLWYMIEKR